MGPIAPYAEQLQEENGTCLTESGTSARVAEYGCPICGREVIRDFKVDKTITRCLSKSHTYRRASPIGEYSIAFVSPGERNAW